MLNIPDELTAHSLRNDLIEIWQESYETVIFVTQDIIEATMLSERISFFDKNSHVFNRAKINHETPRATDDPELIKTEAKLMDEFSSHIKGAEGRAWFLFSQDTLIETDKRRSSTEYRRC